MKWTDGMVTIFFDIANKPNYKEKLVKASGYGLKTHEGACLSLYHLCCVLDRRCAQKLVVQRCIRKSARL